MWIINIKHKDAHTYIKKQLCACDSVNLSLYLFVLHEFDWHVYSKINAPAENDLRKKDMLTSRVSWFHFGSFPYFLNIVSILKELPMLEIILSVIVLCAKNNVASGRFLTAKFYVGRYIITIRISSRPLSMSHASLFLYT